MSKNSKNSKKAIPTARPEVIREVMNRHVTACKRAFAEACREMMLAVALIAPDEPFAVKPEQKRGKPQTPETKSARKAVKPEKKPAHDPGPKPSASKAKSGKPQPPTPHTRMPASVRLTPHEITLNLGSFSVKALADRDAQELLTHPEVFLYRGSAFPDPRRYGVQPSCEAVRVVRRQDKRFGGAPWTVSTTIHVDGDDRKCDSWGVGVYTRNRADQE